MEMGVVHQSPSPLALALSSADKLGQQRFVYNQFTATLDPPM